MTKQIYWLRESAGGSWVTPFAYTGELPERLSKRINMIPSDQLHLPYLERSKSLVDVMPMSMQCDVPGRAILSHEDAGPEYLSRYQIMLALAAAANGGAEPGLQLSGGDGCVIDICEARGWAHPPLDREHRFFKVYSAVARALQRALRDYLPTVYFADPERYTDMSAACPVLLFAASTPFLTKNRHVFTYDVLDHDSIEKFYRSASRGLPQVLSAVESNLIAHGMPHLASSFAPCRAGRMIEFVKRDRNPMRSILQSEAMLFDEFFRMAQRMRRVNSSSRALRTAPTVADEFVRKLHSHLRRFYNNVPVYEMAMPLFIAVTHALYESLGTVK